MVSAVVVQGGFRARQGQEQERELQERLQAHPRSTYTASCAVTLLALSLGTPGSEVREAVHGVPPAVPHDGLGLRLRPERGRGLQN